MMKFAKLLRLLGWLTSFALFISQTNFCASEWSDSDDEWDVEGQVQGPPINPLGEGQGPEEDDWDIVAAEQAVNPAPEGEALHHSPSLLQQFGSLWTNIGEHVQQRTEQAQQTLKGAAKMAREAMNISYANKVQKAIEAINRSPYGLSGDLDEVASQLLVSKLQGLNEAIKNKRLTRAKNQIKKTTDEYIRSLRTTREVSEKELNNPVGFLEDRIRIALGLEK